MTEEQKQAQKEASRKWRAKNRDRTRAYDKTWNARNPGKRKDLLLRSVYGITLDDYNALLKSQNDSCAICSKVVPLVVDHDHVTGKVRGLLCRKCNLGIGHLDDDGDRIAKASEYLKKHIA